MKTLEKVGVILGVILFAILCLWWVNVVNAHDTATIQRYEEECGQDVLCLRNVYYKYNVNK